MYIYWYILKTNLIISAFTFGGGYVVIPMIRKYYVEDKQLITEEQLLEIAAISQSVPGAIAVNLAVTTAYKVKGKTGALLAMFTSILPAFVILSIISTSYDAFRSNIYISAALKGMEAGVAAIMIDVVIGMIQGIYHEKRIQTTLLIPIAFLAVYVFHIHVALVLILSVICSLIYLKWRMPHETA